MKPELDFGNQIKAPESTEIRDYFADIAANMSDAYAPWLLPGGLLEQHILKHVCLESHATPVVAQMYIFSHMNM